MSSFLQFMGAGATGYRYFRITISAATQTAQRLDNFRIKSASDGLFYPTSDMTSNTSPAPLVCTSSGTNNTNTFWSFDGTNSGLSIYLLANSTSSPAIVKIDLGAGNAIVPIGYEVALYYTNITAAWTVEASNDNSTWTLLSTKSGVVAQTTGEYPGVYYPIP